MQKNKRKPSRRAIITALAEIAGINGGEEFSAADAEKTADRLKALEMLIKYMDTDNSRQSGGFDIKIEYK